MRMPAVLFSQISPTLQLLELSFPPVGGLPLLIDCIQRGSGSMKPSPDLVAFCSSANFNFQDITSTVGDSKNVPYFGRGHFGRVVLGNGWELEVTFMLVRRAMKQAFIIISYSLGSSKFLNYCNLKTKKLTIFHPDCETNTRVPQSNEGEIGKCDTSKL